MWELVTTLHTHALPVISSLLMGCGSVINASKDTTASKEQYFAIALIYALLAIIALKELHPALSIPAHQELIISLLERHHPATAFPYKLDTIVPLLLLQHLLQ
jgi:hypothetical protein